MRPIKQREVGQWIEVEFELPREKARKAAQEYYARYPREGYDTHLPKWRKYRVHATKCSLELKPLSYILFSS